MNIRDKEIHSRKNKPQSNSWLIKIEICHILKERLSWIFILVQFYWNWKVARETKFEVYKKFAVIKKLNKIIKKQQKTTR